MGAYGWDSYEIAPVANGPENGVELSTGAAQDVAYNAVNGATSCWVFPRRLHCP